MFYRSFYKAFCLNFHFENENNVNQTDISMIPMFVFRKGIQVGVVINFYFPKLSISPQGSYQTYIGTMSNNRPLFLICIWFVCLFKVKKKVLVSRCIFSRVKNIYTVVVQQDTTHKKILLRASHILFTSCFIVVEIRFMLYRHRLISYRDSSVTNW